MQNYGYNTYQRIGTLKMIPVTNILEANAMPVFYYATVKEKGKIWKY